MTTSIPAESSCRDADGTVCSVAGEEDPGASLDMVWAPGRSTTYDRPSSMAVGCTIPASDAVSVDSRCATEAWLP